MNKYRAVFGFLLFAASLLPASQALAALPERLRERNFNFYPAPFPANDMVLQNVNGGMVSLSGLRGKVIILNFWKIDCPPCSVEKPILERIRQKYARRGLEIVSVNLFDTGDRVKSFCQCGHFGFTFAFDPENRFSVRKQSLPSGMPTAFVINSSSEAIYEIPGVPTTYLINRKGELVGNSIGMVNWEEPPFVELLESLLGPAPQMVAQNSRDFSHIARQGTNPSPTAQIAPPAAGPTLAAEQGQGYLPQTAQVKPPSQAYPSHPFQQAPIAPTPSASQPSPGTQATPSARSNIVPGQPTAKPQATKPAPATRAGKTPQVPKPDAAIATYPRQGSPGATPGAAVSPGLQTLGVMTAPPGIRPGVAPPPGAQPAPPAAAVPPPAGAATLPPLPPALPYFPGRQAPRPNIQPDEQGNVTARIPDYGQGGLSTGALPPSQEVASGNPIGGFILDSFGRVRPQGGQPPQRVQPPTAQTPPSTIFGQLNEDFQALGAGIKDTVSRILPGK